MGHQMPTEANSSSVFINIDNIKKDLLPDTYKMLRVSPQLRMMNDEPSVYDPISVSLGPYHHGKEEFRRAEEFKYLCLHWCTDEKDSRKNDLYEMIYKEINRVRDCYGDVSILDKYDDKALAQMMLLDACFIVNFMRILDYDASDKIEHPLHHEFFRDSYRCLGQAAALPSSARDIMVIENQIPFFILELVLGEVSTEPARLLQSFMVQMLSVDKEKDIIIPTGDNTLHLLEACRRVLVERNTSQEPPFEQHKPGSRLTSRGRNLPLKKSCPSVTYLKTKGIKCHPSSSHSLTDINFDSHAYSGKLQLPVCYSCNMAYVFLSNMIAYEIAPGNHVKDTSDLVVLSYVCLMKSLIQTPADVMELQQKGILQLNRSANHEQVAQMYKSFETFNLRNVHIYDNIMSRIEEHCTNKHKTWMADLINLKFKNPWTVVALLSATTLLNLTFLQTIFTILP